MNGFEQKVASIIARRIHAEQLPIHFSTIMAILDPDLYRGFSSKSSIIAAIAEVATGLELTQLGDENDPKWNFAEKTPPPEPITLEIPVLHKPPQIITVDTVPHVKRQHPGRLSNSDHTYGDDPTTTYNDA